MVKYRWDESAVALLPDYMKDFYLYLLEAYYSFEDDLGPEKSYRVFYLKEAVSIIFILRLICHMDIYIYIYIYRVGLFCTTP